MRRERTLRAPPIAGDMREGWSTTRTRAPESRLRARRDPVEADHILVGGSRADDRVVPVPHQDLGDEETGVVGGGLDGAVGPGRHDREEVARLQGRQVSRSSAR